MNIIYLFFCYGKNEFPIFQDFSQKTFSNIKVYIKNFNFFFKKF